VNVPREGYLAGLREICDTRGALLVADEVQTGIGRTGTMLAVEREGVVPDVIALGKGLGGGFPVGAFLATDAVSKTVALGDHGTTFGGNPLACAPMRCCASRTRSRRARRRSARLGEARRPPRSSDWPRRAARACSRRWC
jgi:acetylornithine/succinyldiaminopimelate/putrescine aminotransferase